MHVMVLGLRGVPDVQGGVETHARQLYPLLVNAGCRIDILTRAPYQPYSVKDWQGLRLIRLWSPRKSGLEALVHSVIGALYAIIKRPDILHIHAVGPMIVTPIARLFGLKVVVTHHGADYEREKWGRFSRAVLKTGEYLGIRFATECITISKGIDRSMRTKHRRSTHVIRNGVVPGHGPYPSDVLQKYQLEPRRYVLQVSRLVPEKRQLDLIRAFQRARLESTKLVLAGEGPEDHPYVKEILSLAANSDNIALTGFQSGGALQALYAHAAVFVLPSSHEGHPIALLEALSYGLRVIASDIPANKELQLPAEQYFPLGDIGSLSQQLVQALSSGISQTERETTRRWVSERYNWEIIAEQTFTIYKKALAAQHS